ncbi:MAG TPA: D-alanine--D-alanine ligase family protein [Candidatus Acidoferrales bacterium]|jgi:D-alanine-D-alanine ligase|nr:D-alanine--D-alanine ligase family protein [Candidatus Acidoferrales bacterium]
MTTEKKRLRIGILFGGRSGEHEVSLISAASVISALDPEKYEAVPIGISKEGRWLAGTAAHKMLPPFPESAQGKPALGEVLRTGESVILSADPNVAALVPANNSRTDALHVDVVFPVLHGTFGEDGAVQGLLDLAGLPYVGSGVLGSAVGMDKDVQKRLFLQAKLPVGEFMAVPRSQWEKSPAKVMREIRKKFRFPVFVKPATLGSSVGMTKAHDAKELAKAMDFAGEFAQKIMVEKEIRGREIELSVLGNEDPKASIPGEIIPHREFYDYAAKYLEEGTRLMIPAKLNRAQVKKFQEYAVRAFRTLECLGMSRVDFFLENRTGKILLNEINTIPGFTSISMYPKLWEASGLPYGQLLDRLIELALSQHRERQRTKYTIELPAASAPPAIE